MEWTAQVFTDIREEIYRGMDQRDDKDSRFITKPQLEKIWTQERLEAFCRMIEPNTSEEDIETTMIRLKEDLLRTLSILVVISWNGWLRFPDVFFNTRKSTGERVDTEIETCEKEILQHSGYLGSEHWAREFIDRRNEFFPITIEYKDIKEYDIGRRLPFVLPRSSVKALGAGASGTVTKEDIAMGQYELDGIPQPVSKLPMETTHENLIVTRSSSPWQEKYSALAGKTSKRRKRISNCSEAH